MTYQTDEDFLTEMKALRIAADAQNKATRTILDTISKELRQFDQETNNAFVEV